MENQIFIDMKFIITENKINDLVIKHLDNMFDVNNIGWTPGSDDMGNEVDYAVEFYEGDYEEGWGENTLFRWYDKEYWIEDESTLPPTGHEYDRRLLNKKIEESPILEFEDSHLSNQLDSIFGNRWEEPFKRWFADNFHIPVKTILK
jgi:hypothetical protein